MGVFFRSLLIVVSFSDGSYANNTFDLWQLSSQNTLASMLLENEGIPLVKTLVQPSIYMSSYPFEGNRHTVARFDLLFSELFKAAFGYGRR